MKRRNFFALLLAPILAKFAPKPAVARWLPPMKPIDYTKVVFDPQPERARVATWFAPNGDVYEIYGDHIISISKWWDRPPIYFTEPLDPRGEWKHP